MIQTVPIETAKKNLDSLLQQLRRGDTVTIVGAQGKPVAVLVSVKSEPAMQVSDWQMRWDALAEKVSRTWKSDKSAVEVLREMRR